MSQEEFLMTCLDTHTFGEFFPFYFSFFAFHFFTEENETTEMISQAR